MIERRRDPELAGKPDEKHSELPDDLLNLVNQVFSENFAEALKALKKLTHTDFHFKTAGLVFPDELIMTITLFDSEALAATSFHASVDYDVKASYPTLQDLINSCIDAIGGLLHSICDPAHSKFDEKIIKLAEASISALSGVPLEWTGLKVGKQTVFLKVDKVNPKLEELTEDWLKKNDPLLKNKAENEHKQTEELFITGEKAKKALH